jgi:hypothetical protein
MLDFSFRIGAKVISLLIFSILGIFLIIWPYLKTEFNTYFLQSLINSNEICKGEYLQTIEKLRYSKIVDLDNLRKSALVYCFYENKDKNLMLNLERRQNGQWRVVLSQKLNKDANFYYPFYI